LLTPPIGASIGENEFLLVEDRDLAEARSERPPPGSIPLAEPSHRESPPTTSEEGSELPEKVRAPEDEEHAEEARPVEDAPLPPVPRPQNTRTIEIERFLSAGQIDARYFEKPYYIVPREPVGQEAFAVICDAMSRGRYRSCPRGVVVTRATVSNRAYGKRPARRHAELCARDTQRGGLFQRDS
jgi:DNA end-binding protein Ku